MSPQNSHSILVPHLYVDTNYVDTNVFARYLEGTHSAAVHFLETARAKNWRCSSSMFTSMELSEIRKEHKFIYNHLGIGTPIRTAFRLLDQKDLSPDDLKAAQERIDDLFSGRLGFVRFYWLEKSGWDRAMDLCAATNITPADCIHLATAIEAGCDLLVTLDSFLKGQAQLHIPCCEPQEVNKSLAGLQFQIWHETRGTGPPNSGEG